MVNGTPQGLPDLHARPGPTLTASYLDPQGNLATPTSRSNGAGHRASDLSWQG